MFVPFSVQFPRFAFKPERVVSRVARRGLLAVVCAFALLNAAKHSASAQNAAAQNGASQAASPRAQAIELVRQASLVFERRDYRTVIALCQKARRIDPSYPRAHTWLGAAYSRVGQREEACASFRRVLALAPKSADAARALRGLRELGCLSKPATIDTSLRPFAVLRGHRAAITSLSFAPNGSALASASHDRTVRVWDLDRKGSARVLSGHTEVASSVAFAPDGRTLASGSYDNSVRLWDVSSGRLRRVLTGDGSDINAIAFSPDNRTLAGGGGSWKVLLWDISANTGSLRGALTGHSAGVSSLAFARDNRTLISAGFDTAIRAWDVAGARALWTVTGDFTTQIALSRDGQLIAGNSGSRVRLREARTGKLRRSLLGHSSGVTSSAFSPDNRTLATGGYDTTIRLWNVQTGVVRLVLAGGGNIVRALAFSPDGRTLAVGNQDTTISLWRMS